ncbi:MAG: RNase P subunit p30 family protein [Candidatus Freyarchaeota archaeon]
MQGCGARPGVKYVETFICSTLAGGEMLPEEAADAAWTLGYNAVFVATREGVRCLKGINSKCKVFLRFNLEGENLEEMRRCLGRIRGKVDVVAAPCLSREIGSWAARNPDVDILYFPDVNFYRILDGTLVRLAYEGRTILELSLRPLFKLKGGKRVRAMTMLRRAAGVLVDKSAPFAITCEPRGRYELKAPRGVIAVARLLGIPPEISVKAISTYPFLVLEWRGYEGVWKM